MSSMAQPSSAVPTPVPDPRPKPRTVWPVPRPPMPDEEDIVLAESDLDEEGGAR